METDIRSNLIIIQTNSNEHLRRKERLLQWKFGIRNDISLRPAHRAPFHALSLFSEKRCDKMNGRAKGEFEPAVAAVRDARPCEITGGPGLGTRAHFPSRRRRSMSNRMSGGMVRYGLPGVFLGVALAWLAGDRSSPAV